MTSPSPVDPYASARDIPTFRELERQLAALKLVGVFLSKDQRKQLRELTTEHQRMIRLVDSFYSLLGHRNWVFTGDLNLSAIEHVVDTDNAAIAEERFISYYQEEGRLSFPLRRLHRFDQMRPRMTLLEKALADYEAGRYYSTVLVLLAAMDGFVNDLDTSNRQGLHARSPESMVAWDSVAGHHLGLGNAHKSFRSRASKTDEREVSELFRHGIMHGTLVNFDNAVVATKAWNRLFAVADWADSRERQAEPEEPMPSLRESLTRWSEIQVQKKLLKQWQPYEYEPDFTIEEPPEVVRTCVDFLERWNKRQWALVGAHFLEVGRKCSSVGTLAVQAKELYGLLELTSWTVLRVRHVAAAVAHADVELTVNGNTYRTDLRWVRMDDAGGSAAEWETGHWRLSKYGPSLFVRPEFVIQQEATDKESEEHS